MVGRVEQLLEHAGRGGIVQMPDGQPSITFADWDEVAALARDWQRLRGAALLAQDELARHQAEAGCADFDRALEAITAALKETP